MPTPRPERRRSSSRSANICLEKGSLDDARKAYKAAGVEISREQWIACGDRRLAENSPMIAQEAYLAAGATEKLIAVGDFYLKRKEFDDALRAYQVAGVEIPRKKLIAYGDRCLKRGDLDDAQRAYQLAGVDDKHRILGERFLAQGDLGRALEEHAAAGVAISHEQLIACGDIQFPEGQLRVAQRAYELAGAAEKLVAVGDRMVDDFVEGGTPWLDDARETYAMAERIRLMREDQLA